MRWIEKRVKSVWIKTLDDEVINTDCIRVIYTSPVDYKYCAFNDKWAVRAEMGSENRYVTLYKCENEQEARNKLNALLQELNNEKYNNYGNYPYYIIPFPNTYPYEPYRFTCNSADTIDRTPHITPYETTTSNANTNIK